MSGARAGERRASGATFPPCDVLRRKMFGNLASWQQSDTYRRAADQRVERENAKGGMAEPGYRNGRLERIAAGVLLIAVVVVWPLLPVTEWLAGLRGWIVGQGVAGVVIFVAIYIIGAVVLVPEALLTIAAGFAYGLWGLPLVLVAATTGVSLAFLIARYIARDAVRHVFERRRRIAGIDRAVAEDGWKIVALLRLSPLIRFNVQNYLFGVTAIPFPHFVAATFAGIIPGTALYTYLGVLGSAGGNGGTARWAFFGAGLLATIVVVILVTRKARAKLREAGIEDPKT